MFKNRLVIVLLIFIFLFSTTSVLAKENNNNIVLNDLGNYVIRKVGWGWLNVLNSYAVFTD